MMQLESVVAAMTKATKEMGKFAREKRVGADANV